MSTTISHPHLTVADDGSVHIGESRYKVLHLAGEHYHYGWTAEELLRQHPDLRPEEVYSALAYFYDHYDQIVSQLSAMPDCLPDASAVTALSREELLRRRPAKGA
jgi:uncharacterized protein (DUF433 family)